MKPLAVWLLLLLATTGLIVGLSSLIQNGALPSGSPGPVKDFTITTSPASVSLRQEASVSVTIVLKSLNGFHDDLKLSGASSPGDLSFTLADSSVVLEPGQTATSQITASADSSTAIGTHRLTITATGQTISHSVVEQVSVSEKEVVPVADFSINATPANLTISAGSSAGIQISLMSINGFSGNVGLGSSVPVGLLAVFGSASLDLVSGTTSSEAMTISVESQSAPGNYTVLVAGTSGSISHSVVVTVFVPRVIVPGDFAIEVVPLLVVVPQGSTRYAHVEVAGFNGFEGSVVLSAVALGDGASPPVAILMQNVVVLAPNSTGAAVLAVASSTSTSLGRYNLTVTGSSGLFSHSFAGGILVVESVGGADFEISADPSFLTFTGQTVNSTITVESLGSFSGTVDLTVSVWSVDGSSVTVSIDPRSVSLLPDGNATVTLSVSAFPAGSTFSGSATVVVSAASGSLTHVITVEVSAP